MDRGLSNEVLRYHLLRDELIPQRTFQGATTDACDTTMASVAEATRQSRLSRDTPGLDVENLA